MKKHHIFYTDVSKQQRVEISSTLCQRGVKLFQNAGHLELSVQHCCTNDPEHIKILQMSSGIMLTRSDFQLYPI